MNNIKLNDIIDYMYVNGIIMGTRNININPDPTNPTNTRFNTVSHIPFALKPYNFPKELYNNSIKLCTIYNKLIHNIASDTEWLIEMLATTAESDPFTMSLLDILIKTTTTTKTTNNTNSGSNDSGSGNIISKQNIVLGILRSDYMIHDNTDNNDNNNDNSNSGSGNGSDNKGCTQEQQHEINKKQELNMKLLQVEINTIASSFFTLSSKITKLYKHFHKLDNMKGVRQTGRDGRETQSGIGSGSGLGFDMPENDALQNVIKGLASAHYEYLKLTGNSTDNSSDNNGTNGIGSDLNGVEVEVEDDVVSLLASPMRKTHKTSTSTQQHTTTNNNNNTNNTTSNTPNTPNTPTVIVMVVQANEHNFGDQTPLEYELLSKYNIIVKKLTLLQLHKYATNRVKRGVYNGEDFQYNELVYNTTNTTTNTNGDNSGTSDNTSVNKNASADVDSQFESDTELETELERYIISVVYFRAGYTPDDYPSASEWSARLVIEQSFAIKCPNIAYHLAGCKKIQQVIAQDKGLIRGRFGCDTVESELLHDSFAGLWSLETDSSGSDTNTTSTATAISDTSNTTTTATTANIINNDTDNTSIAALKQLVHTHPSNYVLKPQREGGGNNIYNIDIYNTMIACSPSELNSFILMERIKPPSQRVQLVRGNVINEQVGVYIGV